MERIEKRIAVLYSLKKQNISQTLKKYDLCYEDYLIKKDFLCKDNHQIFLTKKSKSIMK